MPNTVPDTNINLQEVNTRNDTARRIIAGFSSAVPTLSDIWQLIEVALNDVLVLSAEVIRLSAALRHTRLDRANLLAAVRATIAAQYDGEPDPFAYLQDELDARSPQSSQSSADSRRRA